MTLRLATWNVNSLRVRLPHLLDWLARTRPDVMCLQETKVEDASFPRAELQAAGYETVFSGQRSYNGVAVLARSPLSDSVPGMFGFTDEHKRVLAATIGAPENPLRVVCVYAPNGQAKRSPPG